MSTNSTSSLPSSLLELILKSEQIEVESNTRYYLKDNQYVWFLEEEVGDVYAFKPQDEKFLAIFVVEVEKGGILLASTMSQEEMEYSFFFLPTRKTTLRKVPLSELQSVLLQDKQANTHFAALLEHWVFKLLTIFPSIPAEKEQTHYIRWDDELSVELGEKIALQRTLIPEQKEKIGWVELKQGKALFLSNPLFPLPQEAYFPLSQSLWITCAEKSSFLVRSTENALATPAFWESMDIFHREVFRAILQNHKDDLEKILLNIQKKSELEEEIIETTFLRLGSILNKKIKIYRVEIGNEVFQALDVIGQEFGVDIKPPSSEGKLTPDEEISEICSLSRLYFRKISLQEEWWKDAVQPILAFYGEKEKPVALIKRGLRYEMLDPAEKIAHPLSDKIIQNLAKKGYVFYEEFPDKSIGLIDLFKTSFAFNTREFLTILLVAFAGGLVNLFLPFAMKELFDTLFLNADLKLLGQFTLGLLIVAFTSAIFSIIRNFSALRITGMSMNQLQSVLWGRLLELPASFFRKHSSGNLMNNMQAFRSMNSIFNTNFVKLILSVIYCCFYVFLMLIYSPILTFSGLAALFVAAAIYFFCTFFYIRLSKKSVLLANTIQGVVVQIISGIAKIRVAGAESRFFSLWGNLFSTKKKIDLKLQMLQALQSLVYRLYPMLMTALLFSIALIIFKKAVLENVPAAMTLGDFVGFYSAYALFTLAALDIFQMVFTIAGIFPLWSLAKVIVEEPIERPFTKREIIKINGGIAIDNVSFAYEADGPIILKDVSIVANPGEIVGIVGPTGCGKSTLVRLLLGFESPLKGDVFYDDKSITNFDLRELRKQIGTVLQNAGVLQGSIYQNIVGSGSYTVEEIQRAIRLSGFEEDLEYLPMGLNTVLPMGGGVLSGGQRQRLFLARALVASPKILILDEATSALDNRTQDKVSANFDQINVTRLVIAHRLSTIRHADRIYVMDAGRIIETGTYNELVEKNGLFATMLRRQQL